MPRNSYFAPVGNPTREARLPKHLLELEFLYTGDTAANLRAIGIRTLVRIVALDLATLFGAIIFSPAPLGYLAVFGIVVLPFWCIDAIRAGGTRGVLHAVSVIFLALAASLIGKFLPALLMLLIGAIMTCHAYAIGTHWIAVCTASPLPRATAAALRKKWSAHLLVVSLMPFLSATIACYFKTPWLFPFSIAAFVVIRLFACENVRRSLRTTVAAFNSWCGYNTAHAAFPGLLQSPAGTAATRQLRSIGDAIACLVMALMFSMFRSESLSFVIPLLVLPGTAFILFPLLMQAPLLDEAVCRRREGQDQHPWKSLVDEIRDSTNPIARNSYYLGRIATDGSPLLVDRSVFHEPSHFLGSTGAGKTAKGLNPWIEQTIGFGDSSVIVLDLKADTLESLATMIAAEEKLRLETGKHLPLKVFSSQSRLAMHGFNPLGYDFWNKFDLFEQTDILCGALGLIYGADYGEGYYTSANAMTCYETLRSYPNLRNFAELAERCRYVMTNPKKFELLPNTAKNADHLYSQLRRLADFPQLQVAADGRYSTETIEHAINLPDLFQKPQMLYLHLSSSIGAGSAPTIARLFTYLLLTTASQIERRCRVYLVIDEFQRMVADNLEYIMQLARSMGVSLVFANQSIADLRTRSKDLISVIEANCRFRQWFDVPSEEDRKRLFAVAGETIEMMRSTSVSSGPQGASYSDGQSQVILPRLNINELLQIGDDPQLSIVRISRGSGYAQLSGLPTVVRSGFHISEEEYDRRKAMPWPQLATGMFVPKQVGQVPIDVSNTKGTKVIKEVEGKESPSPAPTDVAGILDDLSRAERPKRQARKRREP